MPLTRFVLVRPFLVRTVACLATCLLLTTIGEAAQTEDAAAKWQHANAAVFDVSARRIDSSLPDVAFLTWVKNVVGDDSKVFPGGYQNPCEGVAPAAILSTRLLQPGICARS